MLAPFNYCGCYLVTMATTTPFNQNLLSFLDASPTPFHAVASVAKELTEAGFTELDERDSWNIQPGKSYFVTRHNSAIIAFCTGRHDIAQHGIRMVGAHTDSPALKVKPNPELNSHGYFKLGVEVYGGALLNPWFDRDLSLAGQVSWQTASGETHSSLIDFRGAIATIPSLAIHLDREANQKRSINAQTDILPLLACLPSGTATPCFRQLLREHLLKTTEGVEKVLDYELFFYDTQNAAVIGLCSDFIASARLDNLLSCHTGMRALIDAKASNQACLLVYNDHEEVGSESATGACGTFLSDTLNRWLGCPETRVRALQNSLMISTDNAHGVHPNLPCLLYTSPSPRDRQKSRMPSSA